MSNLYPLLERNQTFARTGAHRGLSPIPEHQVFVISCIDPRVDPAHILGVGPGDALVLRNAGGRVTDEVINEIAFIAAVTETMFGDDAPPFEVAVIHHTACGTGLLADDNFRHSFANRIDTDETQLAEAAVTDPTQSVRRDVDRLLASPLVPGRVRVSGHVYDVDTGLVETIVSAAAEASR
ncbi:MAG: carbonic anhydrase [Acidimicrobiia bacterium]|nr:carbonic anhydrase [Acidimicrobiia bacterium]